MAGSIHLDRTPPPCWCTLSKCSLMQQGPLPWHTPGHLAMVPNHQIYRRLLTYFLKHSLKDMQIKAAGKSMEKFDSQHKNKISILNKSWLLMLDAKNLKAFKELLTTLKPSKLLTFHLVSLVSWCEWRNKTFYKNYQVCILCSMWGSHLKKVFDSTTPRALAGSEVESIYCLSHRKFLFKSYKATIKLATAGIAVHLIEVAEIKTQIYPFFHQSNVLNNWF